jgi:hypothetical protein
VPTAYHSGKPSLNPSPTPSSRPTIAPSVNPSLVPSVDPTLVPSATPFKQPSSTPSEQPFRQPSKRPSSTPSVRPTTSPSNDPSKKPSLTPSRIPSSAPTVAPSMQPTGSRVPSGIPTKNIFGPALQSLHLLNTTITTNSPTVGLIAPGGVFSNIGYNLSIVATTNSSITSVAWLWPPDGIHEGGDQVENFPPFTLGGNKLPNYFSAVYLSFPGKKILNIRTFIGKKLASNTTISFTLQ